MKALFFFSFLISISAQAVTVSVYQNQRVPAYTLSARSLVSGKSVGAVTLQALRMGANLGQVSFVGDESYIREINGIFPKTEAVSASEVRAYGWCFTLNGELPSTPANETIVKSASDEIAWYYGYVSQINGKWNQGCTPASNEMTEVLKTLRSQHSRN